MNFLAHLLLAGDDDGLRLGAMLGDFVRGGLDAKKLPESVKQGISLHRHIDQFIDALPQMAALREQFQPPFRRYSGIIIDLAFDHELAIRWSQYSDVTLEQFDQDLRELLAEHEGMLPANLKRLMKYADRRGLFAGYRHESEVLVSLAGVGRRLKRPNPLHRVSEIWPGLRPAFSQGFEQIFPQVQHSVADWMIEPGRASQTG